MSSLEDILRQFKKSIKKYSKNDQKKILDAFFFADKKHSKQKRKSGEQYIVHPLYVAYYIAEKKYDSVTVIGALLHDVLENTETNFKEIKEKFGNEIASIVDGVTKISSLKIKNKKETFSDDELYLARVDNYRKILLATISDLRVIIIKLYDRLHNIETIKYLPKYKQKFYARETIEIYAPIAERLGIGELKGKLEDLSFLYAYPKEYDDFIQIASSAYKNPHETVEKIIPSVNEHLNSAGIFFHSLSGRAKHLYSLYNKLKNKKDLKNIFDIVALRVITDSVENCYKALGVIHALYQPIPGRIFDFIARPKPNGYQSLHTTVRDSENNVFEIQIRTKEMHEMAESGQAAHWSYKENFNEKNTSVWLNELKKIEDINNNKDLISTIKEEFFSKRVFVFTPRGDIIDLPSGSSVVDFAYAVHTDVGNKCRGARINSRMMPIKTILKTGDEVEIITGKTNRPSEDWLSIAKTSGARTKIKQAIKTINYEKNLSLGEEIVNEIIKKNSLKKIERNKANKILSKARIPCKDIENALCLVGEKKLSAIKLVKILYPELKILTRKKVTKVIIKTDSIKALRGIKHEFAGCCKPRNNDRVIGYLTKNHIIKVHKIDCKRLSSVDKNRLVTIN